MNDRATIAMTPGEAADLLSRCRKVQLATISRDGTPHLVTMFYAMSDGMIAFWTYRASQKARNLARDPRLTCLVEEGEEYFDLRGVQVRGLARQVADVVGVGRMISAQLPDLPAVGQDDHLVRAAGKRVAYVVEPLRVTSWDHRKLLGP
ncbi:pyridoxamine 5'-phosphate oxidase family protein [Micromonospora sp. WMMA1363]|uniref:pyridoxamine 5'-phosphate oxidase family protein n=1 Tax=Micromonospora sp. WMMA1363 TaxID=3053985 RepID=UPI00259CFB76|nr:pyridoxamine 5'-phosphate oxidase family protein [Micromonospora sp. WMMA1363]MDM4719378.1 pyridoxamine 5'-phosphate oxidase family protein [Micromonospora sp. WMMA1363]